MLGVLLAATIGYVVGALRVGQIPPNSGPNVVNSCYTVWVEGSYYYAQNGSTGSIDFSGTNFTQLFQEALDAMPGGGGIIHLKPGDYEGWITIDRDGVILEGEGASANTPSGLPDDPPVYLKGTVLKVTRPSMDAIPIQGQRNGVQIRDLGIWFTQNRTGYGITDDADQDYHLSY